MSRTKGEILKDLVLASHVLYSQKKNGTKTYISRIPLTNGLRSKRPGKIYVLSFRTLADTKRISIIAAVNPVDIYPLYKYVLNIYDFTLVFKSCKELSNCESQDDEYDLQLQFPTCNKSVRVFCADMNKNDPKEYITLKSGEENNFSHWDKTMSPQDYNHYRSTTKFSKVDCIMIFCINFVR